MPETDFVIAWVDGSDTAHREKRQRYDNDANKFDRNASSATRFADDGELYYLIGSILKYANFIRHIHIITDQQIPKLVSQYAEHGLCDADRIKIIDHDTVFSGLEATLPTFSSLTIEAVLWRIPGLAEQFIYANDDFFINAPCAESDFFVNGLPVIRGETVFSDRLKPQVWLRDALRRMFTPDIDRPSFTKAQEIGAALAGRSNRFLLAGHRPHPLRRSTFEDYFSANPQRLVKQLSFRFRSRHQFSSVSLANNLEIKKNDVVPYPEEKLAYLKPGKKNRLPAFTRDLENKAIKYGCIQSLDEFDEKSRSTIFEKMNAKYRDFLPVDLPIKA